MYTLESLKALEKTEAELVFPKFDFEDAHTLGEMLREAGKKEPQPLAVRIVFDDLMVYQSFLPGTDEDNSRWMGRKCNTVARTHRCSLTQLVLNELEGIKEPWQADKEHYAFCGGGFPIIVDGVYRGVATVSGLPHLDDHRVLTQTIAAFLGKTAPVVPVE